MILWLFDSAEANMLYLETPIGVGFSYSNDTSSSLSVNDKITGMSVQFYPHCTQLSWIYFKISNDFPFWIFPVYGLKQCPLCIQKVSPTAHPPLVRILKNSFKKELFNNSDHWLPRRPMKYWAVKQSDGRSKHYLSMTRSQACLYNCIRIYLTLLSLFKNLLLRLPMQIFL